MILHIWRNDTMWKYRDIEYLTKTQYFKYFITKHKAKYQVIDKNIVIIYDGLLLHFYGFTIENRLYNCAYNISQNKLIEYNAITILSSIWFSEEQLKKSWALFRETSMYNHTDNLMYENDLFYNLWFIDNFWQGERIMDVVYNMYVSKYSSIKEYYANKVPHEYLITMVLYFPIEYAVCLLRTLSYLLSPHSA